jgi:GNAT superfamily N-acetyltransferase
MKSSCLRGFSMTDMLVKLYNLPDPSASFSGSIAQEITFRKPLGSEKSLIVQWARETFDEFWANETDISFSRLPISCYIAQQGRTVVGFACYDTAALGYFGPIGVADAYRGKGIGKGLLLACLQEMKLIGYGYAIIGWVSSEEFYEKSAGAIAIPDSAPGIWKDWLGNPE